MVTITPAPLASPAAPASALRVAAARHGRGLFACAAQPAGATLLMLGGAQHDGAALEAIGYSPGYPLQVDDDRWLLLDAPGVYANHSCAPNAGITADLRLIALRDIAADEEVCFDYSTTMHEHGAWTLACGCGAAECRGVIGDFVDLPASLQKRYVAAGVVQPFILRHLG